MRVELLDDNVSIVLDILFWRTSPALRRKENGKELIDTYCRVSREVGADKSVTLYTQTVARQNPVDDYNKIVGRKVALAKAIAKLSFLKFELRDNIRICCPVNYRKHKMRKRIWQVFHQTFGL